jgi:hypothetical protein
LKHGLCLAATAIALVGCGGGDDDSGSAPPSTAPRPGSDAYILGHWQGMLSQSGMPRFSVSAAIGSTSDPRENRVSYSVIRCRGNWTFRGFEQGAYRFREVIDRGAGGSCKGVGQVTMAPRGPDAARYEFRGGGITSRGLLHREHKP